MNDATNLTRDSTDLDTSTAEGVPRDQKVIQLLDNIKFQLKELNEHLESAEETDE